MLNFNHINKVTEHEYGFSVFGPGELDWGNSYRGWTDATGRLCMLDSALFEVRTLSNDELNSTEREIAEICHGVFQSFTDKEYRPAAIVIQSRNSSKLDICVFAYSKWVKFIG